MKKFRAYRIHNENTRIVSRFEQISVDDLTAGDGLSYIDTQFKAGQEVAVVGGMLNETYDGGYAEYARARADLVAVTGATGGVGSLAIDMPTGRGYREDIRLIDS